MIDIRCIEKDDVADILAIEETCFSEPWTASMIEDLLANEFDFTWVASVDGVTAGFCNFRVIAGEGELMRIAVLPEKRRAGVAKVLMDTLFAKADSEDIKPIMLEVREHNEGAIALYTSYGFKTIGKRKNYYHKPDEDACIMQAKGEL